MCLRRIMNKKPQLMPYFKLDEHVPLDDLPAEHSFVRHAGLFQSILDLAVSSGKSAEQGISRELHSLGCICCGQPFLETLRGLFRRSNDEFS